MGRVGEGEREEEREGGERRETERETCTGLFLLSMGSIAHLHGPEFEGLHWLFLRLPVSQPRTREAADGPRSLVIF